MPESNEHNHLQTLEAEIGRFIRAAHGGILVEDGIELFDLSHSKWRLSIEFGKLMLEAWNESRSIARRVEGVAYRDQGRLGLFVRKPHGRESGTIEIRVCQGPAGARIVPGRRANFRKEFLEMLAREYEGWKFELVSNRSDRELSFSAWYTRGLARKGREGWAFLGLSAEEPFVAADSILSFAILWLDNLRHRDRNVVVSRLKLFAPNNVMELNGNRAQHLNARAVKTDFFCWEPGVRSPELVSTTIPPAAGVRLVPYGRGLALLDKHQELLRELLGELRGQVHIVPDATGRCLSVRFAGLEVARIEGDLAPRVLFGLEGHVQQLDCEGHDAMRNFIRSVMERRRAENPDTSDELYRLQGERWLESLVVRDLTRLDPALQPDCAYSQVPAFSNVNRGVIDILGIRADRRLAVIELKLHEEINLPFQALDYWIAVKELAERRQFREFGYFRDFQPADSPPVLYFVAPAFRFHSSIDHVLSYFDPSIEIQLVGINDAWRKRLRVLFRRNARGRMQ